MEVLLNINNLEYKDLFKNITLSLEKGSIITIAGSNNSGKTTLCRILDRKITGNFNINAYGKEIEEYSLESYNHFIQVVYPKEYHFPENTPLEEIERITSKKEKKEWIKKIIKKRKLEKELSKYTIQEKIWMQILIAILKSNEIVVIDNIDYYFDSKEQKELYELLIECKKRFKNTFIMTTTTLERAIDTDALYIIQNGEFVLHGDPITVLQRDNILNKAGLDVPFMLDLSVKLRDYELIKEIELEKEVLIDTLWN